MAMAARNETVKEWKSALLNVFECPVCLDRVKVPFKLCSNGHATCSDCVKDLSKCPICQTKFVIENPAVIKNLFKVLTCCYSNEGCQEFVEPGSDHELFCGYRPIVCRYFECKKVVQVCNIKTHYIDEHNIHIKSCETIPQNFSFTLSKKEIIKNLIKYIPIYVKNNMFWLSIFCNLPASELKISFQATPVRKLTEDYYASIMIFIHDFSYAYSLKPTVLSDCMHLINPSQPDEHLTDNVNCFRLPWDILNKTEPNYYFNFGVWILKPLIPMR